jgi:hypothetical protein
MDQWDDATKELRDSLLSILEEEPEDRVIRLNLGRGPRWPLQTVARDSPHGCSRCEALFEQALESSYAADVKFVFDDDRSFMSGHWGMLCSQSDGFDHLYRKGMETKRGTGEVRVRGVTEDSFKGFLEWIYLGRRDCTKSDPFILYFTH